jgi:membrane protein
VAGIMWQTVGWLFSSFVANANYTAIYSAFAALFFFMIWIYISWSILLTGASIAFYYQNPEFRLRSRRLLALSNRMKEKVAILLMSCVATNYYRRTTPPSVQDLAHYLNLASESLAPIITNLEKANLLARTNADPARYLPGQAPEVLSVIEIIRAVRTADEDDIMNYSRLPDNDKVDTLLDSYQGAAQNALDAVTLKDLISPTEKIVNKQQA